MHVRIYVYIQFLFFFIVHTPRSLLGWLINLYSHSSKSATQALVCEQWMWTAHTLWSCLNSSSVHTHTHVYIRQYNVILNFIGTILFLL